MQLDNTTLNYIKNVVKTAHMVKVGNIIIENGRVRGVDEEQTIVIFQDKNVPTFSFGSIGLNRLDVFLSRFDIVNSVNNANITATVEGDDPQKMFVRSLNMTGKGIKIDYRCANPLTIKAPKTRNDSFKYSVQISNEVVNMIQKGQAAMGCDDVTFELSSQGASLQLSDINCDNLVFKFADTVNRELSGDDNDISFSGRYPIKTIQSLFKVNSDATIYITGKGFLMITLNGLDVYVGPRRI